MKRAHSVPPNLQFEINDAEDEWVFSQKFDFIHGRALLTCFKDPSFVIAEAYKSLAPGGYLELQDGVFPFEYVGAHRLGDLQME
jgi:trans-aconitate methyltransferase